METLSITTIALDRNLDQFVQYYVENGSDKLYGAVLVKTLSASRPKPLMVGKENKKDKAECSVYPVITYVPEKDLMSEGVYRLHSRPYIITGSWTRWLRELRSVMDSPVDIEAFHNLLNSGNPLGAQCPNIKLPVKSTGSGMLSPRWVLDIMQHPAHAADAAYKVRTSDKDFYDPSASVHTAGSAIPAEVAIANLTTVIYHHRGEAFYWIVIPPNQQAVLEAKIRNRFTWEIGQKPCGQFVRHLSLWITPQRLEQWNITYYRIVQTERQLLFVFPGAYIWGWASGHCVIEKKYHAGDKWNCKEYAFCTRQNLMCNRAHPSKDPIYLEPLEPVDQTGQAPTSNPLLVEPHKRRTRKRKASQNSNKPTQRVSKSESAIPKEAALPGSYANQYPVNEANASYTSQLYTNEKNSSNYFPDTSQNQFGTHEQMDENSFNAFSASYQTQYPTNEDNNTDVNSYAAHWPTHEATDTGIQNYNTTEHIEFLLGENSNLIQENTKLHYALQIMTAERESVAADRETIIAERDNLIQENASLHRANTEREHIAAETDTITPPATNNQNAPNPTSETQHIAQENANLHHALQIANAAHDSIAADRDTIIAERDNLNAQVRYQQDCMRALERHRNQRIQELEALGARQEERIRELEERLRLKDGDAKP